MSCDDDDRDRFVSGGGVEDGFEKKSGAAWQLDSIRGSEGAS